MGNIKRQLKELFFGKQEVVSPDNYNDITENDVPQNDEKFKRSYDDFIKYHFKMTPVEYLRYKQFLSDHRDCRVNSDGTHRYGTIGGGTVVSFMSTGLGNIIKCRCETCEKVVDITDIDSW